MLLLYLTGFGILLSVVFYAYSRSLVRHTLVQGSKDSSHPGRDMWVATLLDCDFEPAKVRFGPAKIIPADRNFYNSKHKEHFSHHMENK